jgi:hypothetical protein
MVRISTQSCAPRSLNAFAPEVLLSSHEGLILLSQTSLAGLIMMRSVVNSALGNVFDVVQYFSKVIEFLIDDNHARLDTKISSEDIPETSLN